MWKLKIAEDGPWLITVNNHVGRQHWEFDPEAGTPEERSHVEWLRQEFKKNRFRVKQSSDLLMRMQLRKENPCGPIPPLVKVKETEAVTEEAVTTTLRRGISFYSCLQTRDGHWPAESAGSLFFLPPLVITLYVIGSLNVVMTLEHRKEIIRYIYNHQNEDGGWGLHIEGDSSMLCSVLNYITLRLLGEGPGDGEDMAAARGRKWILDHGGLVAIPSFGTFWVAVLGVYEWAGCNPLLPELCLLPKTFPIHPGTMICSGRLGYLAMSYIYGKRFVGPVTRLVEELKEELYNEPYHQINWNKARTTIAKEDIYNPTPIAQDLIWGFLYHIAEPFLTCWPFSMLREKALKVAMEHIHYEDENSRYIGMACALKILSLLACWVENPNSEVHKRHLARVPDYYWIAEDGLKIQSFGSQLWDTAFAVQAIISSNLTDEYGPTLRKAHDFIKASQVQHNPSGNLTAMYRHISKGAWTFTTQDQGWQVSDCTAEGLKCALLLSQIPPDLVGEKMEKEQLYDAVNVILSYQSNKGGFPAWEPQRAYRFLEKISSTEFFEADVVEMEYVECTSSAMQGLALFRKLYPKHRRSEIDHCISRAVSYIEEIQNLDGSWYGNWGVCYTYGTWFAVKGLAACGKTYRNSPTLRKACEFLLSRQLPNGGWGESYLSCRNKVYTNLEGNRANLVQTAWALLSLSNAGQAEVDACPIHRGIKVLINSQMEDGDFPQQEITGAFFRTGLLNYSAYRNIFPIWALGDYRRHVLGA
ncbi:hypothetical protein SLA2020_337040 [Shorea laevis]